MPDKNNKSPMDLLGTFLERMNHDTLTKQEFVSAFEQVVKTVKATQQRNEQEIKMLTDAYNQVIDELHLKHNTAIDQLKSQVDGVFVGDKVSQMQSEHAQRMASVKNGRDGVDGKDGRDGVDGKNGKDGKNGLNGKNGKDGRDGRDGTNGRASNSTKFYDLSAQTNGSLKVFSVPKSVAAVLISSDFPTILMENNGFTINATRTQITMTTATAPSSGSQLLYQYSQYFNT